MVIAKVVVSGTEIRTVWSHRITKGMVGAKVEIEYAGDTWEKLNRTAVFQGAVTKDVLNVGSEVTIPCEVVAKSGLNLFMGIYGTDADNNIAIPTLWVPLGMVQSGADPSGDDSTDPTLPVWAQMERRFETLMHLADNPSEMTAVADWDASELDPGHILNRTHWSVVQACDTVFNGDLTGREYTQIDEDLYLVKMSDLILTYDDLLGQTFTMYIQGEDPEEMTFTLTADDIIDLNADGLPVILAYEALWCVQDNFTAEGISLSSGVYFLCVCQNDVPYAYGKSSSCIPAYTENIHKLDNKYLDAEWVANLKTGSETILPTKSQLFSGKTANQSFIFDVDAGRTYDVDWDGTSYQRTAAKYGDQFIYINTIGNQALYSSSLEDNGDPFCIAAVYLGGYLLSTRIYAAEKTDTHIVGVKLVGTVPNRIPYEFLPRVYVMPTDLAYGGVQMDELAEADKIINSGGKVLARYSNSTYQVLHAYRDHIDNQYDTLCMANSFNYYMWCKTRGWTCYSYNSFTLPTANYYEANGSVTQGKKFRFTVDETGALIATDVTGQL